MSSHPTTRQKVLASAAALAAGFALYSAQKAQRAPLLGTLGDDDTEFDCCLWDDTCCVDLPAVCSKANGVPAALDRLDRHVWLRAGSGASPLDYDAAAGTLSVGGGAAFAVSVVDTGTACGLNEVGGPKRLRIEKVGGSWKILHTAASLDLGGSNEMWEAQ